MRNAPCLVIPALLLSCAAPGGGQAQASTPVEGTTPDPGGGQAGQQESSLVRTGVLVPVEPAALSIWPETFSGELLVVEVLAHGTSVAQGDVLARLQTRGIEDQLRAAELELRSAEVRHAGVVEKGVIDEEAAAATLEQARARLERARRALEGYLTRELAFSQRQDELSALRQRHGIEDQQDELDQLERMYEADELVDETEEIVLKRSRRGLAWNLDQVKLSHDRRLYGDELTEPLQTEARQEDVRLQELALDRLTRTQEIDRRGRTDAELRSSAELERKRAKLEELRRDVELFSLRAPRSGVLLHGKARDYRPGGSPSRIERGSRLAARTDVLLVADPERFAVAVDVPEAQLGRARSGVAAVVRPLSDPQTELTGELVLSSWPEAKGGGDAGGVFAGTVELRGPLPEGLVFGMRAKVEVELSSTEPTPSEPTVEQ